MSTARSWCDAAASDRCHRSFRSHDRRVLGAGQTMTRSVDCTVPGFDLTTDLEPLGERIETDPAEVEIVSRLAVPRRGRQHALGGRYSALLELVLDQPPLPC